MKPPSGSMKKSMKRLSYDFHLHSCLSPCGGADMTPANIAGMASVIGLDAIALTDHNTCRNCPALLPEAEKYGISVLCGMELCTAEEVHVLCYFPGLSEAMAFDSYVYEEALPDTPNKPDLFGRQILYNEQDAPCGELEKLLISATCIPFLELGEILRPYGGIMVPAHLDRPSNSLISNLGFIPEGSTFRIAELRDIGKKQEYTEKYPYLKKCSFLSSSDAHELNFMNEPVHFIEAEKNTAGAVFESLKRMQCEE